MVNYMSKPCLLRAINYQTQSFVTYTCHDIRKNIEEMKKDFYMRNRTDLKIIHTGIDKRYEQYCSGLNNFLSQCKCDHVMQKSSDYEKCSNCKTEDHAPNGWACRCEGRNIRIAKERRFFGDCEWMKERDK